MEYLDKLAVFLSNPWLSGFLAVTFIALAAFAGSKIKNLKEIKSAVNEFLDVAKAHKDARDPKSAAGTKYTTEERAKTEKELQEAIVALAAVFGKKV